MSSKQPYTWSAQQARTRQASYGPPAYSTKARSQWDGISLENASSSTSRATEVTPVMEERKRARQVINLCESDDSFDVSIEEPPVKKTRNTSLYSFNDENRMDLDLSKFKSYGQWRDFVPNTTTSDRKKASIFKKVTKALLERVKSRHQKNRQLKRDWGNPYLTALESLHKCAWVFEILPNLTGDLEKTFNGIGKGCKKIISKEVQLYGGLNLWSEAGTNSKNSDIVKFIEDRTKVDTCKPFLTFLRDNSDVILTEHENIVNIFNRDLDVQMLVSGYWFQKHAKIVHWKKW